MPCLQGLASVSGALRGVTGILTVIMYVTLAAAGGPAIDFDFGRTVACREVLSAEGDGEDYLPSDAKLVEFTLKLSVHLQHGSLADVQEIQVELSDYDRRVRVHRLSPGTLLASDLTAPIEVTRVVEDARGMTASLGGELPAAIGSTVAHLTPSLSGNLSRREVVTEKELRAPPQTAIVTGGTIDRQHGALFKLRPSSQTSLEGVHELTLQLVVPHNWRADALRVRCRALGEERLLWMKQQKVWSDETGQLALFLRGDDQARRAAETFAAR